MKIKTTLSIGFPQAEHHGEIEIDDEELKGLDDEERRDYILTEYVRPWANDYVEYWFEEDSNA